ncbi:Photosynthetic reaction center cytochrome C subunit [Candidatus Kryptobacter tengchongensis]|uniref:Photosynthetic reaction center cytochrome c subunit n=1 Tax=Kryptobacter tengchongensis TaxID=1643429 RepID=A0A656D4W9_KRYT1|nr:c-type cytochrome [Candidatus Kryptobacter tengchongensis]CUS98277.1 Photosynthetic reaction center cytochrome C subunit [Candidatus Kryptobacter tengchongensis]CUT00048.1 Photosynthetic reaction center cytochrome C subunit [Candidatus Kryptobacter tengchongensis]CUU08901.1 Photosynthetic reaction center cytochrome C subunit [Candidatus Kryptobacter tengchongensis]
MRKTALFYTSFIFLVIIGLVVAVDLTNSQSQRRFGRNLQVLTEVQSKEQLQKIMEGIADALGVKCNYCHDVNNYASDVKETKKKARVMLKMVMTINRDFINWEGAEVVDCYTCHRGQTKPQIKGALK